MNDLVKNVLSTQDIQIPQFVCKGFEFSQKILRMFK